MKNARVLNILSLLFNVAIVGLTAFILVTVIIPDGIMKYIIYFTVLSNFLVALVALITIPVNIAGIIKKERMPRAFLVLKLVAAVQVTITMVTALTFLPSQKNWDVLFYIGNFDFKNIYFQFHLLVPALSILSFLLFDQAQFAKRLHFVVNTFSLIPVLAYGAFYIANHYLEFVKAEMEGGVLATDWYGFFAFGDIWAYVIMGIMIVGAFLISIFYWLINRALSYAYFPNELDSEYSKKHASNVVSNEFVHDEHVKEVKEEAEVEKEAKVEEEPAIKEEAAPAIEEEAEVEAEPEVEEEAAPEEEMAEEPVKEEPVKEEKKAPVKKVVKKAPTKTEETKAEAKKEVVVSEKKAAPKAKKEEKVAEEAPVEEKKVAPKAKKEEKATEPAPVEEKKTAPKTKKAANDKEQTKVYHLTKRKEDDKWAITFVGGQKAVKLFKTKKEAEEYLEVLTKNQGATALIRNSKGAKAGKFASSIKSEDK